MSGQTVTVRLTQVADYRFDVHFADHVPALRADEPPPLGRGEGPSPMQLLAAAVGNCLADSLLFALRKFRQQPEPISAQVDAEVGRNAEGRLRVLGMTATLTLGVPAEALDHLERVLGSFETYCTVTQSVNAGFPVAVQVFDAHGSRLK
jgi:uncharacterized OsmC-like protein